MLFKKKNKNILNKSKTIYNLIIKQSRLKKFYTNLGVPDTVDGRFELIILHFFIIDNALDKKAKENEEIYKEILEIMYKDFDMSLREMGVGDLSVGKKIYHMTEAFSGRVFAYRKFKENINKEKMKETIRKNIYGTLKEVDSTFINYMLLYIQDSLKFINNSSLNNISENNSIFLDLNRYIYIKKGNKDGST